MENKSLLIRGFKTRAEEISVSYREKLNLSKFNPLNAFKLAEYLKIPIFSHREVFEGEESNLSFQTLDKNGKFNAMWLVNSEGDKLILHNSTHALFRQQSNLMHELSHIILKHEVPEEVAKICALYGLHYYNKRQEEEAKYLGACLQITRASLMWVLKNDWSEQKISEYFSASVEMVRYRLNSSGVAKQRAYMNNLK